jgi:hypothetical protein
MTTPQPSPRDIERANKIVYNAWVNCPADVQVHVLRERDNWTRNAIAQALAEVRAEFAAFADAEGKPREVLESCDAGNGVYKIGEMLCRDELDAGESVFVLAAIAARKETK